MPKNIDDVMKEILKNHKETKDKESKILLELNSMKKTMKSLDKTVSEIFTIHYYYIYMIIMIC